MGKLTCEEPPEGSGETGEEEPGERGKDVRAKWGAFHLEFKGFSIRCNPVRWFCISGSVKARW